MTVARQRNHPLMRRSDAPHHAGDPFVVDTFAVLAELGGDPGGATSPFVEVVRSISGLSVNSCCEGDGGGSGFVEGAVAEHGEQDVDALG